MHKIE